MERAKLERPRPSLVGDVARLAPQAQGWTSRFELGTRRVEPEFGGPGLTSPAANLAAIGASLEPQFQA